MTKRNTRTGDRLEDNSLVVNAAGESSKPSDWIASAGIESVEKFTPGPGWVLFEREAQDRTVGKIHLVAKSDKDRRYRPTVARVVKVGPPMTHQKSGVRIDSQLIGGERVIINRFCGHDLEIGGKLYVVATEDEIVLVIGEADRLSEVA